MEETKILNELIKYIPEKVAKRTIYLIKLAKNNNIPILTTSISEGEKDYMVKVNLLIKKIIIWHPEEITRIAINLNDITTETTNIERTEQIKEYTKEELEILNRLLSHISRDQAERVIYLMRLAKENNLSYLLTLLYEGKDHYIKAYIYPKEINICTGEIISWDGKYKSINEWLDEANKKETKITIPL